MTDAFRKYGGYAAFAVAALLLLAWVKMPSDWQSQVWKALDDV